MNLKEIKQIIQLMNENALTEIEIEREGEKIRIKKSSIDQYEPVIRQPIEYRLEPPPEKKAVELSSQTSREGNTKVIASPMVGTFYLAPSPESPPFVEIGQIVEIGQVVCIVEAMKLMNEIKSEVKGKVLEVAVGNAEPVEFGQTLFVVEPV
jgi:acetyl-CoA carboxylase biotin carboxyl carrier protein